jgi:hypothetical protein
MAAPEDTAAADDMADFLGYWGADSDDGDLPEPEPVEPEPERATARRCSTSVRRCSGQGAPRRVSVCLGLAPTPRHGFDAVEAAARGVGWPEREMRWHGAKPPSAGCGFESKGANSKLRVLSKGEQEIVAALPGWAWLGGGAHAEEEPGREYLSICCSVQSPKGESPSVLAAALVEQLLWAQLPAGVVRGALVLLVSDATKIPLVPLPRGLSDFVSSKDQGADAVAAATRLLEEAGMLIMPDALSDDDARALAQLAMIRTAQVERALASPEANPRGSPIGSGDVKFAEICSRGVQRWDMLLHPPGQPLAVTAQDAASQAMVDAGFAVMERVANNGPWVPALEGALGLDASGYKWQASLICSRPGAPAGNWHADGPHSRHMFGGESGRPYGFCVFVPLVSLLAPQPCSASSAGEGEGEGEQKETSHGLGCTVFWPGSHRHIECVHLGSIAATALGAVVSGAPLRAGGALVYDYRLVHCAAPNDYKPEHDDTQEDETQHAPSQDAGDVPVGDRPILQLVYTVKDYDDVGDNYGWFELLEDTDISSKR